MKLLGFFVPFVAVVQNHFHVLLFFLCVAKLGIVCIIFVNFGLGLWKDGIIGL